MWTFGIRQDCQGRHDDNVHTERLEGAEGETILILTEVFQAEGTACAKALRLDGCLAYWRNSRRPMWQEQGERGRS